MQDVLNQIETDKGLVIDEDPVPLDQTYWWPQQQDFQPSRLQISTDIPSKIAEALPQQVDYQHGLSFEYSWDHDKVRVCYILLCEKYHGLCI